MGYVSLVADGKPQLKVLLFLLEVLFVHFDASLKTQQVNLFLREPVEVLKGDRLINLPDPIEVHVDLPDQEHFTEEGDSWTTWFNLPLK